MASRQTRDGNEAGSTEPSDTQPLGRLAGGAIAERLHDPSPNRLRPGRTYAVAPPSNRCAVAPPCRDCSVKCDQEDIRRRWIEYAWSNLAQYDYKALPDPARTIHVNPFEITRDCRLHVLTRKALESGWKALRDFGRIIEGDWDLIPPKGGRNVPSEETNTHMGVFQRYVEGHDWQETPIFAAKLKRLETGEGTCRTPQELVARYRQLDEVYESIRCEGWRLQEALGGWFADNVWVSISRTGGFLFADGGKHRLAIAKLLRLPTVEVYVLARHTAWQETRDRVATGQARYEHPDLDEFTDSAQQSRIHRRTQTR